jgi:hypothetical protein
MKSIQSVLCFFFAASLLLTSCSTSNHQSNASAELSMIGENGEHIPVEPAVTDASLTDRALEVSSQLEAQPYIETALIVFSPSPEDEAQLCFQANLRGSQLDAHADEIWSIATQGLDAFDAENSAILDASTGQLLPLS